MALRTDRAIVVRLADYSETSQVVSLYTRAAGLVRLLAKGIRRSTRTRFSAGLDLLELGQVAFNPPRGDAGLGTLTDWAQVNAFAGLRRSLVPTYAALYAAELLTSLTEEYDPHPGVYAAFEELLGTLSADVGGPDESGARVGEWATATVRFQAALLRGIGLTPNLRQCAVCGSPQTGAGTWLFSSHAGGLVCRNCAPRTAEKRSISSKLLGARAGQAPTAQWFDLLDYHLTHQAGRRMRTAGRLAAGLSRAGPAKKELGEKSRPDANDGL